MTKSIASLSMYDWPETGEALDRLWTLIANNLEKVGISAPSALTRANVPMQAVWTSPDLLIGQTCGWPYASTLRGKAVPFARFHYALEGCPAGHYQSYYIGRSSEDRKLLDGREALLSAQTIAVNGDDSQSGFHVYREITGEFSPEAIEPEKRLVTGSHRNSIAAVSSGRADIAAIDAVAFKLAQRYDGAVVDNVSVLGKSKPKPGLPLITAAGKSEEVQLLYQMTKQAVENLSSQDKDTLLISGIVPASDNEYDEFL